MSEQMNKISGTIEYQLDGEPCSLYKLVTNEPTWAVARINYSVDRIAKLEAALERMLNKAYKQNWTDGYLEELTWAEEALESK